jgi:hypothetical protein
MANAAEAASPAAISASSARATPSPRRRSACPTMPAHNLLLPYCPLSLVAAVPLTNSISPIGLHLRRPIGAAGSNLPDVRLIGGHLYRSGTKKPHSFAKGQAMAGLITSPSPA